MQSENLTKAKPELEKIEKKYKNKNLNDQAIMMQKSQEMMAIYKNYSINPMSGCLFSFIQIPLFFAFYEALNRLPIIFEGTFLGFGLGTSPMTAMGKGNYIYIIIIVLVIGATYLSMKLNKTATMSAEQEQQMKMMSNMMVIFIGIASLTISTSIALYWITNNTFTIIQNLLVHGRCPPLALGYTPGSHDAFPPCVPSREAAASGLMFSYSGDPGQTPRLDS